MGDDDKDKDKNATKEDKDKDKDKDKAKDIKDEKKDDIKPAPIPKKPEPPKLPKLINFDVEIGMPFSMGSVSYEIDMLYKTRTDEYVKCSQPKDKLNEEYPKRIYLEKQQLRYVQSDHMNKLREQQVIN